VHYSLLYQLTREKKMKNFEIEMQRLEQIKKDMAVQAKRLGVK